jgi:hypothetical protein
MPRVKGERDARKTWRPNPGDNKVFGYPPDLLLALDLVTGSIEAESDKTSPSGLRRSDPSSPATSIETVPPIYTSESDLADNRFVAGDLRPD